MDTICDWKDGPVIDHLHFSWAILSCINFTVLFIRELIANWNYDPLKLKTKKKFMKTIPQALFSIISTVYATYVLFKNFGRNDRTYAFQVAKSINLFILWISFGLEVLEDFYKRFNPKVPKTIRIEIVALIVTIPMTIAWVLEREVYEKSYYSDALRYIWLSSELMSVFISIFVLFTRNNPSLQVSRATHILCLLSFIATITPLIHFNIIETCYIRDLGEAIATDFSGVVVFTMVAECRTILRMKFIRSRIENDMDFVPK